MRRADHVAIAATLGLEDLLRRESDAAVEQRYVAARYRALAGEPLTDLATEVFALVREAADRALGLRHFPQQLAGGLVMARCGIAEMATGEGKTLTATLPLALHALVQRGAHLATANDYLARRDADWMRPVFARLGLTVGALQSAATPADRRRAYRCDITYGAAREFGFDFLRDHLGFLDPAAEGLAAPIASGSRSPATTGTQRDLHFALIDEVDSILLDEARTPLLISGAADDWTPAERALFVWSAEIALSLRAGSDYTEVQAGRRMRLTSGGRLRLRMSPKPPSLDSVLLAALYEAVERAVFVRHRYLRDRDYVVRDGEVVIVDEFTGRLGEGRHWSEGVHQAVEAQERLQVTPLDGPAARITVQDLFLRYRHLAGMSATVAEDRRELKRVFRLPVTVIPSQRPVQRRNWAPRLFRTGDAKLAAVVAEVVTINGTGRPVLIGTRSIDKSEQLSRLLSAAGIVHQVLNAQREAEEAEIVKRAGERCKVTVATNMAGRGTDIKLPAGVPELGGLHVIGTELHESPRIDRQLFGRCARQGDPGTCRQFAALDDDLLSAGLGPLHAQRLQLLFADRTELPQSLIALLRLAQRRLQKRHRARRRVMLYVEQEQQRLATQLGMDYHLAAFGR